MRALTFAAGSALLIAALLLCSVRADPQAKKELRDEELGYQQLNSHQYILNYKPEDLA